MRTCNCGSGPDPGSPKTYLPGTLFKTSWLIVHTVRLPKEKFHGSFVGGEPAEELDILVTGGLTVKVWTYK